MSTTTKPWTLSIEQQDLLIKSCFEAKEFAYTPYSKFRVGAALLAQDSRVIKGSCIDNIMHAGSICAERVALVKAVSEGIRSFIGLAITTDVAAPVSPCGLCRQFIREFCSSGMPILLIPADHYDADKGLKKAQIRITNLGELLPFSYSEHLDPPQEPS